MPLLSIEQLEDLLEIAALHRRCGECGQPTAMDYCRSCDEFYWIHQPGCAMHEDKHHGHRLYIVPYVEDRSAAFTDSDAMLVLAMLDRRKDKSK
jgi:hypothetical protein